MIRRKRISNFHAQLPLLFSALVVLCRCTSLFGTTPAGGISNNATEESVNSEQRRDETFKGLLARLRLIA